MRLLVVGLFLSATAQLARADVNVKTCAPEPGVTDIAYGDLVNCEIDPVGDSDLFKFAGVAGERVWISVLRYGGNADACFRIIDPENAIVATHCIDGRFSTRGTQINASRTLDKTGAYTIQVLDGSADEKMVYGVSILRYLPPATESMSLTYGSTATADINPRGDVDSFRFNGAAGDTVAFLLARRSNNADACFWILDPDGETFPGTPRCIDGRFSTRAPSISADFKWTKSGPYSVLVYDGNHDETFAFTLEAQCFGTCPSGPVTPPPPPPPPPTTCTYLLSPSSRVVPTTATTATFGVITGPGCQWTTAASAAHLTISSGASGTGPGTVQVAIAANTGANSRTGTIAVEGQTATITQSGTTPLLLTSPTEINFTFRETGAPPTEQILSLYTNTGSLTYSATTSTPWVTVQPASGSAPASVIVQVNPGGLGAGTHQGSITINSPSANPSQIAVPVRLTIESAGTPKLQVDAEPLLFSFARGSQGRTERRAVVNFGSGTLQFGAEATTASGGNWLQVSPAAGQATLAQPASLSIAVDPSALEAGTYTGQVVVTAGSETRNVPVTITVSAISQSILLSQSGLTYTAVAGGGTVPPQSFGVLNVGAGVMDWTVRVEVLSGGTSWLAVTSGSGSTDADSLSIPLVNVAVNHAGLPPGEYHGHVRVEAAAAGNSPQFVSVVLNVLPPGSDPGPLVRPTGLIFTGVAGGSSPEPQTVQVANLSSVVRSFTSGRLTTDAGNWFTSEPSTAQVQPAEPVPVQVRVNNSGLAPGIRRGVLTFLFADGSVRTVNLLSVLAAGITTGTSTGKRLAETSCTPSRLIPLITSMGTDFNVPAGWPNLLEARVVDDCGNALTEGSVVATFSNGDPPLPLVSHKNGRWESTWQARNVNANQITVVVDAQARNTNISGRASVTGGLRNNIGAPLLGAGGIVSAVSFAPSAPVAPGSWLAIFGSNLSNGKGSSEKLPLERELAGTLATIAGKPMPLLFASEGQVNAMVPYGIPVNTRHHLIIRRGNTYTVPETIAIAAAQPALYSTNGSGRGQGIIVRPDGRIADAANPAAPNSSVVIYCAGLGEVDPTLEAGTAAPNAPPARVSMPVQVSIGGKQASVQYAGLVAGLTGFYQINATVPEDIESGDAVPVIVTVQGQSSPPVSLAVRAN